MFHCLGEWSTNVWHSAAPFVDFVTNVIDDVNVRVRLLQYLLLLIAMNWNDHSNTTMVQKSSAKRIWIFSKRTLDSDTADSLRSYISRHLYQYSSSLQICAQLLRHSTIIMKCIQDSLQDLWSYVRHNLMIFCCHHIMMSINIIRRPIKSILRKYIDEKVFLKNKTFVNLKIKKCFRFCQLESPPCSPNINHMQKFKMFRDLQTSNISVRDTM